jgi:type IV pilus assembly protein PilO
MMELNLEALRKMDRTKKWILLCAVLGVMIGIYVWALYLPMRAELQKQERKLTGLLNKKAEQEAIVQNLEAFKAECRNLEIELQKALAQLPNKKEIPTLLQNISNLGRESGLEMPFFKPGISTKKDFYAEVPVDIKLLGPYQNMLSFFFQVGALPRIVTVQELTVQYARKDAPQDYLDAACKAVTYRFLEESEREPPKEKGTKKGKSKEQKADEK